MSEQVNLVPASGVDGNITTCKIENQIKSVQKNSVFSIAQTNTYMTYDVCNKQVIAEYTTPGFASGVMFWILVPFVLAFALGLFVSVADN